MQDPTDHSPPGVDGLFVQTLLGRLGKQFNLTETVTRHLQADAMTRIGAPRRSEVLAPLAVGRLRQENRDLLAAFRSALTAIPRHLLDDTILHWRDTPALEGMAPLREVLLRLENRMDDGQLGQIYIGCINALGRDYYKSQSLPINWDGFRFRLLFAAADDVTPRGHLNYFCNFSTRVVELLVGRGYDQKLLRSLVEEVIQAGGAHLRHTRQEHFSRQVQEAVHEMGDSLQNILRVVEEVIKNVAVAVSVVEESQAKLTDAMNFVGTRRAKLIRNLAQVEAAGVPLPGGLRERLQEVVATVKEMLSGKATLAEHPERLTELTLQIKSLKRKAHAVSFEFRRVRRRSETLLRKTTRQLGQTEEGPTPCSILERQQRHLLDAARALIWSYQDASYALEVQDALQQPALVRVKAAMLDEKVSHGVIGQLETAMRRQPFDVFRFRMAGKKMLALTLEALHHVPMAEIAKQPEDTLWASLADLSDAYQGFALLIDGEETQRLLELPNILQDLQQAVGRTRQDKVLTIAITPALARENRVQKGLLRLSVAERLENLHAPLRDLLRVSLTMSGGDVGLAVARQRAMHTLGVTREPSPERGCNYLAELTVIPLARLFVPCDPRYGRTLSELESRIKRGPIPGLSPPAILFGVRQPGSLENLGRLEEAADRERRAHALVNRSGLLGVEMGLHPLWDHITESDDAQMLAAEMRPLFAGDAGQGFLSRVVSNNPEYEECLRLDEEEKMAEANLLLEALTSRNGFSKVQQTIFEAVLLLVHKELAQKLDNRREFLLNQRGVFHQLGIKDPAEYLRPTEEILSSSLSADLDGLLAGLEAREQELVLLQLFHRRLLRVEVLGHWIQTRYPSRDLLVGQAPGLVNELLERYHWLLRSAGSLRESEAMATLLDGLEMEQARQAVEEGVTSLAHTRSLVTRYRVLKADQDITLTGRMIALLRGNSFRLRQLEGEIAERMAHLRWLGLAREAAFLQREMNQPLEDS